MAEASEGSDCIKQGVLSLFQPAVENIDLRVKKVRESQAELLQRLEDVSRELKQIRSLKKPPIDLDPFIKRLGNCRRKILSANTAILVSQERLQKLNANIKRETERRKSRLAQHTGNPRQ